MIKVITYGTFDMFHQGHYNILKRARALGDYLIVGVTSESYDIERGKLNVKDSLLTRIQNVQTTGFADEIIIEEYQGQKVRDIIKYEVDIFVVGSDWIGKFDYLNHYCRVVYLERTRNISSSMLREEKFQYRIGIVSDDEDDSGIVTESNYVSGLHVEGVFSPDMGTADTFCSRYELNSSYSDYASLLSHSDIVYIKSAIDSRAGYIDKALKEGKNVISDVPISRDPREVSALLSLAKENHLILAEKIIPAYLRAFNQLIWMVHCGLVGNVVSLKCSLSMEEFGANEYEEPLMIAICMIFKLMGRDYTDIYTSYVHEAPAEGVDYYQIVVKYPQAVATIELGTGVSVPGNLLITGDKGSAVIPDDWWNTGYFRAQVKDSRAPRRYSFNFDGNGFRYLLQEMVIMMQDHRTECSRVFPEESRAISQLLSRIESEIGCKPCEETLV